MKTIGSLFNLPRQFFELAHLETDVNGPSPSPAAVVEATHAESHHTETATGEGLQDDSRSLEVSCFVCICCLTNTLFSTPGGICSSFNPFADQFSRMTVKHKLCQIQSAKLAQVDHQYCMVIWSGACEDCKAEGPELQDGHKVKELPDDTFDRSCSFRGPETGVACRTESPLQVRLAPFQSQTQAG
jgi:hypothetical protein